ncbi:hypothetical protein B5K11_25795 [Rhizobium leguminosarum bv. trifolii]|nr:hypothetical protein B5K11_25795 [Rhizobium leguminosarum bv. trifolii]
MGGVLISARPARLLNPLNFSKFRCRTPVGAPALARCAEEDVIGNLWERPQLSRRDRTIVTLSVLIARNQAVDLKHYVKIALDNGITPTELSEIITQLAFYSGWSNAMSAIAETKEVFAARNIAADQLPAASPQLLPLNEEVEQRRAEAVETAHRARSAGAGEACGAASSSRKFSSNGSKSNSPRLTIDLAKPSLTMSRP